MQPTLVILAAGMGSRFGGNKQIENLGPSGETIMDYSVYDAIKAGFGKVVFVIKDSFRENFVGIFNTARFNNLIKVEYAFQEVDKIPAGFSLPTDRTKPWGTHHALMMAKELISEPFGSINADDFYGRDAFLVIGNYLSSLSGKTNHYCVMGYNIIQTLVNSGGTSRAECIADNDDFLVFIEERTGVQSINGIITGLNINKNLIEMDENTIVSMNFWGFTPDYFHYGLEHFKQFLSTNLHSTSAEILIQSVVNDLIKENIVKVRLLNSNDEWFGLTYQKDKAFVVEKLNKLINQGVYPVQLWS
jgi:hypothetical protein